MVLVLVYTLTIFNILLLELSTHYLQSAMINPLRNRYLLFSTSMCDITSHNSPRNLLYKGRRPYQGNNQSLTMIVDELLGKPPISIYDSLLL